MDVDTSRHAVNYVSNGEDSLPPGSISKSSGKKKRMDWQEFFHLLVSWGISGIIIFIVLLILTMADKSTDLWHDIVIRIDTISLVFSLVLSAGLEQVWNNKRQWKFKLCLIGELFLASVGLIMYLTYSLWSIYDPKNSYFTERFFVNLLYIVFSVIFVVVGFILRALVEQEEK